MRRAQQAVAAVAILAAVACVALMVEAGRQVYRTLGPSHALAAGDGSLYVTSHGRLHIFGPGGERRAVIDLAQLGVATKPSDIALHADGRIVLVDPDTSLLQRCTLPRGPCEKLDLGLAQVDLQAAMPLNAAKLAIDDAAQRYYVSDNAGHRLVIADFLGHVLGRSARGTVWYPNHLFVSAPGELTVVDTNHQRIATFDVHGDRVGRLLRETHVGASRVTRAGRGGPFDSTPMPDGQTAVLVGMDHMRDADLVVLDRAGHAVRRIDLGPDSDPFDIERWGDRLVVADGTRYELQAIDFEGRAETGFPPAEFRAELARERERAARWRWVQQGARAGIVAAPLIAILVLWRLGVPLAPRPAPSAARPAGFAQRPPGTQWITYDAAFLERERRRTTGSVWMVAIVAPLALGLLALMFSSVLFTRWGLAHLGPPLAMFALMPLVLVPMLRDAARRRAAFRMGASDGGLRVVSASGLRGEVGEVLVPWPQVYADGSRLLAGRQVVLLRNPVLGDMFDREAVAQAILARIPQANTVSPSQLTLRIVRARPKETLAPAAGILVLMGLYMAWKLGLL